MLFIRNEMPTYRQSQQRGDTIDVTYLVSARYCLCCPLHYTANVMQKVQNE